MAFTSYNTIVAADVNVLGLQIHFRPGTTLAAAVAAAGTSITVENAQMFEEGDTIQLTDGTNTDEVTISSISGNVLTTDATTNAFAIGDTVRLAAFVDLGHVQNPSRAVDIQEQDIQSAREGRLQTIKKITTSISKSLTFESMSVTASPVLMLHRGRRVGEHTTTPLGSFVPDDTTPMQGELLVIQKNAETSGKIVVEYRPAAQISGTDEQAGDGENPALLIFEATILTKEGYVVPTTLDDATPAATLGFSGVVSEANLDAVLDAIAG